MGNQSSGIKPPRFSALLPQQSEPRQQGEHEQGTAAGGHRSGASPLEAYQKALACDPVSAFGSVIAFTTAVDDAAAEALKQLGIRGHAEVQVTDDGVLVYDFYDIRHLGGKASAKGVLDA